MANFSSNFVAAIPAGIDLANEWREQRKHNSARKAGDLLAQLQSYDPESMMDFPETQGLPEEGQTTVTNPSQGFSGMDYKKLTDQYFAEAAKGGDLQAYAAATQLYGEMRKGKVMDAVNSGLTAYGQGDINGATRYMRKASAFLNPGVTPEINYDHNTDSFVVANYKDGKVAGGYALKPDDMKEILTDIGGRTNDFGDWARLEESKDEFNKQMALKYAQFNASERRANASAAASSAYNAQRLRKSTADASTAESEATIKGLEAERATITQPEAIKADTATLQATTAQKEAIVAEQPALTEKAIATAKNETDIAEDAAGERDAAKAVADQKATVDSVMNQWIYPVEPKVAVPPGAAGPVTPPPGNQTAADLMGGSSEDSKGKEVAYDPEMFDIAPDGSANIKPEIGSLITKINTDFETMNGGPGSVPIEAKTSLISGVLGRSQHSTIMMDPGDPNAPGSSRAFITDGVYKLEIGADTYQSIFGYLSSEHRDKDATGGDVRTSREQDLNRAAGDPLSPLRLPPEPGAPQDTLANPEAPGAWSPQGAIPGPVAPVTSPTGGPTDRMGRQGAPGLPTEDWAPGAGLAPAIPDDTAAILSGSGNARAGVIDTQPVADLGSAIAAWEDAGRPDKGQEYDLVIQYLNRLPEMQRRKVAREIYNSIGQ